MSSNFKPKVFGLNIKELTPGDHYAPYSKICTPCGSRHGGPGSWLAFELCEPCARKSAERERLAELMAKPKKSVVKVDPLYWDRKTRSGVEAL